MRTNRLPLVLVALLVTGVLAVGAAQQPVCGDTYPGLESRLRPADPARLGGELSASSADDLSLADWALTTGAPGTGAEVVDAGGWTAYVDGGEVSRLGEDGSVLWTRPVPDGTVVHAGDGRVGVLRPGRERPRVAVVDADGVLVGCEDLRGIDAELAVAQEIRHGDVTVHSVATAAEMIVAVLELHGSDDEQPVVAVTGWDRSRADEAPIVSAFVARRPLAAS
ncbi:MAG: hypothetical protein AAFZ07_16335 [Actinomycetota bacterium]